jgi:DNA invertase Pin-like site-specific DNA recombinase
LWEAILGFGTLNDGNIALTTAARLLTAYLGIIYIFCSLFAFVTCPMTGCSSLEVLGCVAASRKFSHRNELQSHISEFRGLSKSRMAIRSKHRNVVFAATLRALIRRLVRSTVTPGISAGSLKRPELQRLLVAVRSGQIAQVYVTKLDRLSRNLGDLLSLVKLFEKHDVALVSASESIDTTTAAGSMLLQLLGVFAQFERGRTSERIRDVLGDRRTQRKVYSRNIPFGYRREDDRLIENPGQQAALAEARRMHADGASLRQIASRLTELNVTTNCGGSKWHAQTVKQVLSSRITVETAAA